MTSAQLLAGAIALGLLALIVAAVIRLRLPGPIVVFLLMFGLPAAGFATYAVLPGPSPNLNVAIALAITLYGAAFVGIAYAIVGLIRRGKPTVWSMASDSRRYMIALLGRWFLVLWISSLLFLFEPGFALANVALNLVWMLAWLPRRLRTSTRLTVIDIAAQPNRVFEFVTDVRNWKLYRDDVELVSVTPVGPLTVGSEYVARVVIPESLRRTSYSRMEFRYRVTAMVPGESFDTKAIDQSAVVRTLLEPTPSGTRLTRTSDSTTSLLRAWAADTLNNRLAQSALSAREVQNGRRIREILEAKPAQ